METKVFKIYDPLQDGQAVAAVGKLLREGGLAAIPTETVYGLAANALDPTAVEKIFLAKGRPQDNPLIVHIASLEELAPLVEEVPETAKRLAEKFWPGPLTMIFKKSPLIPQIVSAGLPTVAIRFPSDPVARAIIRAAGVPLAAPSANLSGSPSPTTFAHIRDDLTGRVEALVASHDCAVGVESTVVALTTDPPRLLRPGGITLEALRELIPEIAADKAVFEALGSGEQPMAPGMKYKHYAPKAQVTILKGSLEAFCRFMKEHAGPGVMALCFEGEEENIPVPCIPLGGEHDGAAQAHRLFWALREVDRLGATHVYARCPEHHGVGLAVYNRLLKAAGYEVIAL